MNWEDEDYVRVYVRDTPKWIRLGWEAQAVFVHLMRKLDRDGYLELGEQIETDLADYLRIPVDVVRRALPVLLQSQCVVLNGVRLFVPHFVEAQEARRSAAARKREERRREKAQKLSQTLESSHTPSQSVARESHEVTQPSHNVTLIPNPIPIPVLCSGACTHTRDLKEESETTPPETSHLLPMDGSSGSRSQNNPTLPPEQPISVVSSQQAPSGPSDTNGARKNDPGSNALPVHEQERKLLGWLQAHPSLARVASPEYAQAAFLSTLGNPKSDAALQSALGDLAGKALAAQARGVPLSLIELSEMLTSFCRKAWEPRSTPGKSWEKKPRASPTLPSFIPLPDSIYDDPEYQPRKKVGGDP